MKRALGAASRDEDEEASSTSPDTLIIRASNKRKTLVQQGKWTEPDEVQRELLATKTELSQVAKSHNDSRKKGNKLGREFNEKQNKDPEERKKRKAGSQAI